MPAAFSPKHVTLTDSAEQAGGYVKTRPVLLAVLLSSSFARRPAFNAEPATLLALPTTRWTEKRQTLRSTVRNLRLTLSLLPARPDQAPIPACFPSRSPGAPPSSPGAATPP